MNALEITNQKFGRLTAIERVANATQNHTQWLFKCDCGNTRIAMASDVKSGKTHQNCGCLHFRRQYLFGLPLRKGGSLDGKKTAEQVGFTDQQLAKAYDAWYRLFVRQPDSTLTFLQYINKMKEAGLTPDDIGRRSDDYQLARYSDEGPYTNDSCRFITAKENHQEATVWNKGRKGVLVAWNKGKTWGQLGYDTKRFGTAGNRHPMFGNTHSEETKEKIRIARAEQTKQMSRNTSGYIGICWNKQVAKWQVQFDGKYLGLFETIDDAVAARRAAEQQQLRLAA